MTTQTELNLIWLRKKNNYQLTQSVLSQKICLYGWTEIKNNFLIVKNIFIFVDV
jgi:hypothetical protein